MASFRSEVDLEKLSEMTDDDSIKSLVTFTSVINSLSEEETVISVMKQKLETIVLENSVLIELRSLILESISQSQSKETILTRVDNVWQKKTDAKSKVFRTFRKTLASVLVKNTVKWLKKQTEGRFELLV